ncbi:MAG: EpsI family protein [Nitrospirae bacterium]|nr:EpsI family protein [Nitrospirota bacterium]
MKQADRSSRWNPQVFHYIAAAMIVAVGLYLNFFLKVDSVPPKKPFSAFPRTIGGWTAVRDFDFDKETMANLRVDDFLFRSYTNGDRQIQLYIGYYRTQREGAQIHSPKHCLPGSGWFQISEAKRNFSPPGSAAFEIVEAVYQKERDRTMFLYWYDMHGRKITNEYLMKLAMIWHSIADNRSDAAFIRLSIPDNADNTEKTLHLGEEFLAQAVPQIESFLP